ncbi:MAG: DALR anticodon-binding domain-containing protein [Pseudonocardiaceae bacterium]
MTPAMLAELVRASAADVLTRRGLDPAILPATVIVERPRNPEHGDYVTNVALQTAVRAGVPPREFARWLAEALAAVPGVRSAEVAGPGFLNLRLAAAVQAEIVRQVLAAGTRYGAGNEPGREGLMVRPVGDVQYAHARLVALARNAADLGVSSEGGQLGLLEQEREGEMIRMLGEFPRIAASDEPERVVRYLARLAQASHDLTDTCRVLPMGDEEPGPRHAARLALCQATRQVLANGLRLLGCSAPERM